MGIVLTGASGFIGRSVLSELLESGEDDVVTVGRTPPDAPEVRHVYWDMAGGSPPDVDGPVTAVIHMAARANFVDRCFGPVFVDNLAAAVSLACWAAQKHALFVFASAAGVHGRQGSVGSGSALDPQDDYTLSKLASEVAIRAAVTRTLSLRIGGVYGIDGPSHLGLNRAITGAVREAALPTIEGPGRALRNYICVEDVARWIRLLVQARNSSRGPLHETVYIAHTESMSVREYITEIADIVCRSAPIEVPGAEGGDFTVRPDTPPFDLTSFQDYLRRVCGRK
jgi:nucleoside-diphosphate-sugar epimerase